MNSSLFSVCFLTDTKVVSSNDKHILLIDEFNYSGASSHGLPNKDAFTKSTLLNMKTKIISNNIIDTLNKECKLYIPHVKLWFYDINKDINIDTDFEKLVCIILFINGVYGIHYVCNIDNYTITQQKQYIIENIISNYKLYSRNSNTTEFRLLINTFDSNGNTKTSDYEITF
jgi:hypothetical protein